MNPLNLTGPAFLAFWLFGAGVVALAVVAIRHVLTRVPGPRDARAEAAALHPTEIAYLAGGVTRAVQAAVVGLEHRGLVAIRKRYIERAEAPLAKVLAPRGAYRGVVDDAPLAEAERHVLANLPAAMDDLVDAPVLDRALAQQLVERELLVPPSRWTAFAVWTLPLGWWLLGAAKLGVGLARERPVGALVMLLGAGAFAMWTTLAVPRRTALGDDVIDLLVRENRGLGLTSQFSPELVSAVELSLAFALFGPIVLSASLLHAVISPTASSVAGGGSSGGSSDGGGGGCGGGGGGGGGGCGGGGGGGGCGGGGGGGCGGGCGGCG